MRKATILLMLVIVHFTSFSQSSLSPIIKEGGFYFTTKQTKEIAKYINHALYCDTIVKEKDIIIKALDSLDMLNRAIMKNQVNVIANSDLIINNTNNINEVLHTRNETIGKSLVKERRQKNFFGVAAIVLAVLVIVR